jgi:hypothetical protein
LFKQQPTQKEKAPVLIPADAKHSVLVADKSKHNKQTTFLIYLSRKGSVKIAKHTSPWHFDKDLRRRFNTAG